MMSLLRFVCLAWLSAGSVVAAECAAWAGWNSFRKHFINDSGRVTDPATSETTSEGQAYALFFALVANDRKQFSQVLRWTEDNLAGGDLTARLPAWQWGKRRDGNWGVIDNNSASDADLWIAYTLAEAARLWAIPKYQALGQLMAERILREEKRDLPGLGNSLLPGQRGFQPQAGLTRLNPSYMPIQLMRRMAALYPESEWKGMVKPALALTTGAAPKGFAPDWILYQSGRGFLPDAQTAGVGSLNAIRVYLWSGMLDEHDPARPILLRTFAPMARHAIAQGTPPLQADTRSGLTSGAGPAGFSAALLPFLAASRHRKALTQQRMRVDAKEPFERADNYYEQALAVFGLGWIEARYRFARDGALNPRWTCAAK